ncbi:MAG: PQQ-binding-like beta-propeller repeat protein [Candidatus Bathyarchaeia archaeon]
MKELAWLALAIVLLLSTVIYPVNLASGPLLESNDVDEWWMFRHDLRHSGFSTSTAPNTNKTTAGLMWNSTTGGKISKSSPAVVNGVVFVGASDGKVYAFNATNGDLKWQTMISNNPISSSPAVAYGKVFVGTEDGNITALDANAGGKLWSRKVGSYLYSSPAVSDGVVFVSSSNGTHALIYALNEMDGAEIWKQAIAGGGTSSSPAVADGMMFIATSIVGYGICALNKSDGNLIWKNGAIGSVSWSSPAINNGKVFIGSTDYNVYALNEFNGNIIWFNSTGGMVCSSPAVAYGKVFIGSQDKKIYAFDEATGTKIWTFTTGGIVDSSPAVADGKVFIGSNDGKFYALNATTGTLMWNFKTGGKIDSSPAVAYGWVYVGSEDKKVYAFGPNSKPNANFTYSPEKPAVNEIITFNASLSYDPDQRDRIVAYTWDFGDGTPKVTETDPIITHSYGIGKTYIVTLNITDTHGAFNITSSTIKVYVHDVKIEKIEPSKYVVALGETVNVSVTVKNYGTFNETNLRVAAYYNDTPTQKYEIEPAQYVDLTVGESKTLLFIWDTSMVPVGNYTISATVNSKERYDGVVKVKGRDLAVEDIIAEPNVVRYDFGENTTILVTVKNHGYFDEQFNLTVYCINATWEIQIGNRTNETLHPLEEKTFQFLWNTTGLSVGNYMVSAYVTIVPYDIDPTNNNKTCLLQVRLPIHDVIVTQLEPFSFSVVQGETLRFNVTVQNLGDYLEAFTLTLYKNGTILEERGIVLAIGASNMSQFTLDTTFWEGGIYNITAFANVLNDITPLNNNKTVWGRLRLPVHDIAVREVKLSKDRIFANQAVDIYVTVENIGNFTESFPLKLNANTTTIGTKNVINFEPGTTVVVAFHWTQPPIGNYVIWANASLANDNNPNDNICNATTVLSVLMPIHDVAIINLQPSKTQVLQNRNLTISITVQNQGAYPENNVNITVYANLTKIWSILITLEIEDPTYTFSWDTTGFSIGKYTISATISIPNDEDSTDNSFTDGTVEVIPPTIHDVAVTEVGINVLPWWRQCNYQWVAWQNCTGIIYVSVENKGHFDETFNLTIYADRDFRRIGDEYILSRTVVNLKIEEAKNLTVYCDITNVQIGYMYWITASISPVFNETLIENNNKTIPEPPFWYGRLWILKKGDLNGDGKVDMKDVGAVARDFGATRGPDGKYYRPSGEVTEKPCDITGGGTPPSFPSCGIPDGRVDMKDVGLVAREFGK